MPNTISVEIRPALPASLKRLEDLVGDLYYTCENEVPRLFRFLDEECWEACGQNPKVFLRRIAQGKLDAAVPDPVFLVEYRQVLFAYDAYPEHDLVAYFSAEFGFHVSIPIYAGGLGILSGDYLKSMSNLHVGRRPTTARTAGPSRPIRNCRHTRAMHRRPANCST